MLNGSAIFMDFSNTITTVKSEYEAVSKYLDFIKERYQINDDVFGKFTRLRFRKLDERVEGDFRTFMGINKETLFELYGITEMFAEEYYRFHEEYLRLRPDFKDFIDAVKPKFSILMVTDADNTYTERTLSALTIRHLFDSIITAENVGTPKPNNRIFEAALEAANFPSTVLFIGDSEKRDIEGAKRMKFISIRMDEGSNPTVADATAHNFTDVVNIMKTLNLL